MRQDFTLCNEITFQSRADGAKHSSPTAGLLIFIAKNRIRLVKIPDVKIDERRISGFLYFAKCGKRLQGCIFTEKSEPTVRRRFSAAHELGHYLLHFLPLSAETEAENLFLTESLAYGESNENLAEIEMIQDFDFKKIGVETVFQMESEADIFAAELLMPRNACLKAAQIFVEIGKNKKALINRLATEFLVSFEAMKRRLEDLQVFETEL